MAGGGGGELESPTSRSEVQRANQYTTMPPHSAVECCPRFLILLFKALLLLILCDNLKEAKIK